MGINGRCQNNCQVTSSRQLTFDTSQYCCVDLAWPSPKCIYRDNLRQGDGWGWQHQRALLPDINAKKSPFAPQQVQQFGGYNPRPFGQRPAQHMPYGRDISPQPERRYNPMQQYAQRDRSPQPRKEENPFHLPNVKQHNVMYNFGNQQQQQRNNYWGT